MLKNRVQLVGNLGDEPKITKTNQSPLMATISLATNEGVLRNGQWETLTQWHQAVFFGKLAEIVAKKLHKGSYIFIEGKLRSHVWQDETNQKRRSVNIVVSQLLCLEKITVEKSEEADKTAEEYLDEMYHILDSTAANEHDYS